MGWGEPHRPKDPSALALGRKAGLSHTRRAEDRRQRRMAMASEVEFVETLRAWVEEDRSLAEAARASSVTAANQVLVIRWFSGAPDTPEAERARLVAQAEQLEQLGAADEAEASAWEAAADGWQAVISDVEGKAPSS